MHEKRVEGRCSCCCRRGRRRGGVTLAVTGERLRHHEAVPRAPTPSRLTLLPQWHNVHNRIHNYWVWSVLDAVTLSKDGPYASELHRFSSFPAPFLQFLGAAMRFGNTSYSFSRLTHSICYMNRLTAGVQNIREHRSFPVIRKFRLCTPPVASG